MKQAIKKRSIESFDRKLEYKTDKEVAIEAVVPDTMPDIERILFTQGELVIRSKEVTIEGVAVTANLLSTVFYVPESGRGLLYLNTTIPVNISIDASDITDEDDIVAMLKIRSIEARMLNPRKVLVRANLKAEVEVYERKSQTVCEGLVEENEDIELDIKTSLQTKVVSVKEKTFVLTDEFYTATAKPEILEIMGTKVDLICDEVKTVGRKIVVNGRAVLKLIYKYDETENLGNCEFETNFSQILDTDVELKSPETQVISMLTAKYIELGTLSTGGKGVLFEVHAVMQVVCLDVLECSYLADCYSNKIAIEETYDDRDGFYLFKRGKFYENVHETYEMDIKVEEVVAHNFYETEIKMNENKAQIRCGLVILARDTKGEYFTVTKKMEINCDIEEIEACEIKILGLSCNSIYIMPMQNAFDIRISFELDVAYVKDSPLRQIEEIEIFDENIETEFLPSLVLLRVNEKDNLWDLAKRYKSKKSEIMKANDLETEVLEIGDLLLIPVDK